VQYVYTTRFKRDSKKLSKSNPHFRQDLIDFLDDLDPMHGEIIPETHGARKIRMAMLGKGKSGSYRVIYFVCAKSILFLTIYGKNVKDNLTSDDKREIRKLISTFTPC